MSTFEDSYKSQLQGVSQQIARERLDGQVTAQENMLSDPVTNLRRRPGAAFAYKLDIPNANDTSILAWDTDLAGVRCQVILNTADGVIRVLDQSYNVLATLPASAYLTAVDSGSIQVATVGDEFFLCNTEKRPAVVASTLGGRPQAQRGMFYVKAGAFSKDYDVTIKSGSFSKTYTVTTPDGTHAGDAALANPINLAKSLSDAITADILSSGVYATYEDQFVYLETTNPSVSVTSGVGSTYIVASGKGYVRDPADLPARMPASCIGYIIATGAIKAPQYYTYDQSSAAWLECGDAASPAGISNMPVSVTYNGAAWSLNTSNFEGRLAGDDVTNPLPQFLYRGISGIGTYQGRLVLLAGSMVNLSASAKPRRFFRSTVTSIIDSDCIEVGASAASSAAYRYAVPFGKDLLLFSEKYQALIPGGSSAITPRTAAVVVTSTYASDMTSRPVTCGRTLMYSAPRSKDFFGLLEMLPSSTVEAQYTSYDSTAHLPKYMAGRCRFSVSSSVSNMVLFAPSNDRRSLIVHEYTWQGDEKVQQAWHKWTFPYNVAAAYFSGQVVHVLFVRNGILVGCTIDARGGTNAATGEQYAKLDFGLFADVVGRDVKYPAWLTAFDSTCLPRLRLAVASGPLSGEPVGCTASGTQLTTVLSYVDGKVALGFPYASLVSPSPPMKKDSNGVKVSSNKLTVLRFMVGTSATREYDVQVQDAAAESSDVERIGPLSYSSQELELGFARVGGDVVNVVPCRTNADSTTLVISTNGVGELNIVSLEYVGRYHEKIKRAWRQ